jgi:imidazolonepropionase-like amidohydrolase
VTPGKRADLLILSADPVADIHNTRRVETVIKDGRVYEPQPLLDRAAAGAAVHDAAP